MTKMGRPPKADGERRSERLEIRLTEHERAAMNAAACACGIPLSEWIRLAAIAKLNETHAFD